MSTIAAVNALRLELAARSFTPIPLFGKEPAAKEWQKTENVSRALIEMWTKTWPHARNTGVLCKDTPTLDLDLLNQEAVRAITDELVRERFDERGYVLIRHGKPPKLAIPFRTITPFKKLVVNVIAPNGNTEKIEFLGDGQQLAVHGIHPDTKQPYRWFGGEPWAIEHDELPYLHEHEARALVIDATMLLKTAFGYTSTVAAPKSNGIAPNGNGDGWKFHLDNIRHGRALHDSITQLAAMLIRSGMDKGATIHLLGALVELSEISHDERWEARYRDIPRAVDSAVQKYR
jgi:hypothetical protein